MGEIVATVAVEAEPGADIKGRPESGVSQRVNSGKGTSMSRCGDMVRS